jgi:hypothetical protein
MVRDAASEARLLTMRVGFRAENNDLIPRRREAPSRGIEEVDRYHGGKVILSAMNVLVQSFSPRFIIIVQSLFMRTAPN